MASQLHLIFDALRCQIHSQSSIMQVCVSSACPQNNKLCCLECVDEQHMGHEHVLISKKKFNQLLQEFHAVLNQKQQLNMKLLEKLKNRQDDLNSHVDKYFKYIEGSLVKENELTSYEELNQLEVKSLSTLELKRKMNEFVGDHSWILELNAKGKSSGEVEAIELATEAIRQKYEKLSRRLQQINSNCELEIKQAIERRSTQVTKLFHLFEEVKYRIEDEGKELDQAIVINNGTHKNQPKTPEDSPCQLLSVYSTENKGAKSVFSFLGNLVGSRQ